MWLAPAASAIAVLIPITAAGACRSVVVPSPTWPLVFVPQHLTVPLPRSTQVCDAPPAATATGPVPMLKLGRVTGTDEPVVVPLPSWPYPL